MKKGFIALICGVAIWVIGLIVSLFVVNGILSMITLFLSMAIIVVCLAYFCDNVDKYFHTNYTKIKE